MPDEIVSATEAAREELAVLRERFGPLMLFQSGGCCDGSSPLCLREGELPVGANDLLLGAIDGVPFYIDVEQYERWKRPSFVLDVRDGAGDAFSLEALDRKRFITHSPSCAVG